MQTSETTGAPMAPTSAKKVKKPMTDNSGYKPNNDLPSLAEKCSHYMDWAADNRPLQFLGYNEIAQCAMGLSRLPRMTSDEVKVVKRAMGKSRKILDEKYGRGAVTKIGVGVRATTDDLDRAKHDLTKKATQLATAADRYVHTLDAIDASKMASTGESGLYKQWVQSSAKETAKRLTAPSFKQSLLPPGTPDKEKK